VRYLILSDIHSNLEAYEKCLEAARGLYETLLCLGDLVGYGPDPNAIVEGVCGAAAAVIRGNHDKACAGITDAADFNPLARMATRWTQDQLTDENLARLRNLIEGPLNVDGFELVHGSPRDEDEYIVEPFDARPAIEVASSPLVFFGHTHVQGGFVMGPGGSLEPLYAESAGDGCVLKLQLKPGSHYLLNPGSVGQPRDRDWRAGFAILDSKKRQVEYYRTGYDLARTQEKMEKAGLPEALIMRLAFGR
jgi:predicted phosphodiesterase